MQILTNVTVADQYNDAGASLENILNSNGGYFLISNNDVFMQMAYNIQGQILWTQEIHIPVGSGTIYPGTAGIRFRNFTPGSNAVVSAAISENREPSISIGSSGVATPTPTTASVIYFRKTTPKVVSGTVAETDLLNGELTIAANILGQSGFFRMTCWGDLKQNSGGTTVFPRFKVKLGSLATVVLDTGTAGANMGNSATRFPWRFIIEIMNLAATNSQLVSISGHLASATSGAGLATFVVGEGVYGTYASASPSSLPQQGSNPSAIDSTIAMPLQFTVINPSASANVDTTLTYAIAEVYPTTP